MPTAEIISRLRLVVSAAKCQQVAAHMSRRARFCRQTRSEDAIASIHVWVGVYESGAEKITGTDIPMPDTADETRYLMLIHTRRDAAERMRRLAEQLRRRAQGEADALVRVELRQYHMAVAE